MAGRITLGGGFRSLGIRNYRWWFAGATVSNVGTWIHRTAQDWLALTDLTDHDASAVGITTALQFLPVVALAPLAGMASDRLNRRKLLLTTQITMAVSSGALGYLCLAGVVQLWMVYAFALALALTTAFDGPARHAFASELVSEPMLANAVALNSTSFNLARLAGPAAAGILTATAGAGWAFTLNAGTFGATILALRLINPSQLQPLRRSAGKDRRFHAGLAHIQSAPDLAWPLAALLAFSLLGMNFPIFVSTMAAMEFGADAGAFGLLSSAVALGSVAGALWGARRSTAHLHTMAVACLGFGVAALLAAASPSMEVFGVLLIPMGLSSMTVLNVSNAYIQARTPAHLRGRVMSVYIAVTTGSAAVGAPLMGALAGRTDPRWALAIGALGGLLPAVTFAMRQVRQRRRR